MTSSGEIALATTTNAPVTLIAAAKELITNLVIIITGTPKAGFLSTDSGRHWGYVPAASAAPATISLTDVHIENEAIMFKRVTDGDDVSGLYAWGV